MQDNTDNAAVVRARLEAAYGPPSQAGFGSAVFYEPLDAQSDLATVAQEKYRFFVGDLWERWGEAAWMAPWREIYRRPSGAAHDIVSELRAMEDPAAALSVPMLLDNDAAALAAVLDDPAMRELRVYTVGDGAAMSGLLLAGRRAQMQDAIFLIFLLD